MPRSSARLATNLQNLIPTANALAARQEIADSYGDYMSQASASGRILSVTAATAAMSAAMNFPIPGTAAGAAAAIQAGCVAFWASMVASPVTSWASATVIVPPAGLLGITAALSPIFVSNVGLSLAASATAIAAKLHSASNLGTVTYASPPPVTIL